jgi:hypothetical protein
VVGAVMKTRSTDIEFTIREKQKDNPKFGFLFVDGGRFAPFALFVAVA